MAKPRLARLGVFRGVVNPGGSGEGIPPCLDGMCAVGGCRGGGLGRCGRGPILRPEPEARALKRSRRVILLQFLRCKLLFITKHSAIKVFLKRTSAEK